MRKPLPARAGHHAPLMAVLLALASVAGPRAAASGQEAAAPVSALQVLVARAVRSVAERYARPLGRVVERRRGRVFVTVQGELPSAGTLLVAARPVSAADSSAVLPVSTLQVERATAGLVECHEVERIDRERAERGDLVRLRQEPPRLLISPCISLVDLAPVVSEVIGEKLRAALLGRAEFAVVDDAEMERRAEAAYWSGEVPAFLRGQAGAHEILFPVLLQTPGKLVLNLEYFSVQRQRATHVDVAAVETDAMLAAWLRAGTPRRGAPPGFRYLIAQLFPGEVVALAGAPGGGLFAVRRDSVLLLDFEYPGLRPGRSVYLGPRDAVRREAYAVALGHGALPEALQAALPSNTTWVLSDERSPRILASWLEGDVLRVGTAAYRLESSQALENLWLAARGPAGLAARWWPMPELRERRVVWPLFADLDGDGYPDLIWSDERGALHVQRLGSRGRHTFRGYGDVKAVQQSANTTRAVLWLTDPVCCGAPDRLHAAQLVGDELRVAWSSQAFEAMLVAVVSHDLNGDAADDLVAAEAVAGGTRLHVFLALPGEQTAARGSALPGEGAR